MTIKTLRSLFQVRALVPVAMLVLVMSCKKAPEKEAQDTPKKSKAEGKENARPGAEQQSSDASEPGRAALPVEPDGLGKILAKVGGVEITEARVEKELARNGAGKQLPPAQMASRRKAVLDMLVNDALVRVSCEKEGLFITPEELASERARWVKEAGSEEAFQKGIQARNLGEEGASEIMRSTLLSEKLVQKKAAYVIDDDTVKKEYDKQKGSLKSGPQVKISEIFLPVVATAAPAMWDETMAKAEQVLGEIKGGLSFAEAAKKFSKGPTFAKGGTQASWAGRKRAPKELYEPAFGKNVGDVYGPIRTTRGVYLAKVDEKRDSTLGDFETEKVGIRMVLERSAYEKNLRGVLEQLKTEFPVEYLEQ